MFNIEFDGYAVAMCIVISIIGIILGFIVSDVEKYIKSKYEEK